MTQKPSAIDDAKFAKIKSELKQSAIRQPASADSTSDFPDHTPQIGPLPTLNDDEIGRVVIPQALFLSRTESHIEIYVPLSVQDEHPDRRRNQIAVGEYLVIPLNYRDEKIFGIVDQIRYSKRHALDDTSEVHAWVEADNVDEKNYAFTALVTPLSMFADGDPRAQEVRYLPKPNSIARRANQSTEIRLGLNLPDEGLFLGHVAVGGEAIRLQDKFTIPLYLKNDAQQGDPLIFTHTLIAGMSGRGKTFYAKNFLRQLVEQRYPLGRKGGAERQVNLILIDPDNEYHQMAEDGINIDAQDLSELQGQRVQHGKVERLNVFDAVEAGAHYAGAASHTPFSVPFALVEHFPYLIAGGELNEAQYEALVRIVEDFFAHKPDGRYEGFCKYLMDEEKVTAKFVDRGLIHEGTLKALRRRVVIGAFKRVFDQPRGTPITQLFEDVFADGQVSVFPTDHLSNAAERVVVLAIMSMVADAKTKQSQTPWAQQISKHPVVLAVDEAHNYLAKSDTQQEREINQKFISAAKQGRKNGLGLVLITQNPQDIHDDVLSQISNRLLLGMERKMAEAAGAPKEFLRGIPYFGRGRMVVHSPDNCQPVEVQGLDFCLVKHR